MQPRQRRRAHVQHQGRRRDGLGRMKAHSSTAGFAAALAPEMRARGDAAAGGGDCRWALLKTRRRRGHCLNVFCFLRAAPILAAPRVASVAALFFVISMPLLADQNLRGFQGSLAAGVEN